MNCLRIAMFSFIPLLLPGCAATIDQGGLEQRTAQAIGRPVGQFSLSERSDETGGRIQYTATTRDGQVYRCHLYSATGFQRAMSFGQTPHSDALCSAMAGNGKPAVTPPQGNTTGACNALLKAAKRC